MAYTKVTYRSPNAEEIEEYHSGRYGAPGQKREKKKKPTPEQMGKVNQRKKEDLCRRKLRKHFRKKDMFVTLTYAVQDRPPDMETAKGHFRDYINQVRKEYKKRGYALKWIRNIEVGTRNAWHIHMAVNRIPDADLILTEAWPHGQVDIKLCYSVGEFRDLAAYLTKTPKTDKRLREASYSTSRNIPLPEPEKKVITRWETWRDIKAPAGFYLDKDSVQEGINPVTGYPYRKYTFLRINDKEVPDAADRRYLHRDKPARPRKGDGEGHVHHARKAAKRQRSRERPGGGGV